jgi:hypothetical protein
MRIAGLPVWALVLAACVVVPFVVQVWIDAERRRAKERTRSLLQALDAARGSRIASGPRNAASQSVDDMHHGDDSSAPRARGAPDS